MEANLSFVFSHTTLVRSSSRSNAEWQNRRPLPTQTRCVVSGAALADSCASSPPHLRPQIRLKRLAKLQQQQDRQLAEQQEPFASTSGTVAKPPAPTLRQSVSLPHPHQCLRHADYTGRETPTDTANPLVGSRCKARAGQARPFCSGRRESAQDRNPSAIATAPLHRVVRGVAAWIYWEDSQCHARCAC